MKILVISQVFPPTTGGSGRWLWELYRRVSAAEVHVAAGEAEGSESFDQAASLPITRIHLDFANWGLLHSRSLAEYARGAIALNQVARRIRPDVIHAGKCLPEGLIAAAVGRWRGLPFWCYAHGEELTLAKTSRELTGLASRVLCAAAKVVANSQHTSEMLVETWGVAVENVAVLHPGVDTTRFEPCESSPEVRARLGWTGRRVILTVGALQKRKGQDTMIRALPAILARCPDVLYAVAGQGWERLYLQELANQLGVAQAVQFCGVPSDADLVEHYQQCDVFALPNRQVGWDFEGFGIALLEAQACGKPVIAGQSGGAPETICPGQTGVLVPGDDPTRLADAALSMLEHPEARAAMGQRGRQWVVERFEWSALTRQAQALFAGA
jgi:phosphatidyl-myo-inositol dimannoside synthase